MTAQSSRQGAVAVVVREGRFLVIRRSAAVVAPGAFCFPGGGIEAGETEEQAVVREFHEELGASIRPVRCGDSALILNPTEVASVHWLSPDEMLSLDELLDSNRAFLKALADGEIVID